MTRNRNIAQTALPQAVTAGGARFGVMRAARAYGTDRQRRHIARALHWPGVAPIAGYVAFSHTEM